MTAKAPGVRRLIFDISLLWAALAVFMMLFVPAMNAFWMAMPKFNMPIAISFIMGPPLSGFWIAKQPVWRQLPVSGRQVAVAQWCLAVGGPLLGIALSVAVPAVLLAAAGSLRVSGPQLAALFCAESAAVITYPAAISFTQKLSGRFGMAMAVATTLMIISVLGSQLVRYRINDVQTPFFVAGTIALGIAAWTFFRREPLIGEIQMFRGASGGDTSPNTAPPASRGRGWATFTSRLFWATLGLSSLATVGFVLSWHADKRMTGIPLTMASAFLGMAPLIGGVTIRSSIRALRLAGGTAAQLAMRMQVTTLVCVVSAALPLWIAARLVGADTTLFPVILAFVVGLGSCFQVYLLRLTNVVAFAFFMPLASMLLIMPLAFMAEHLPHWIPQLIAFGIGAFFLGWLGTWLELSRGYRAYRAGPFVPVTWRGQGGA